jgi:hypothetical protein
MVISRAAPQVRNHESKVQVTISGRRYHPQQSDLKPHAGQRQTACMRYISAPQRSQGIAGSAGSLAASAEVTGVIARTTSGGVTL